MKNTEWRTIPGYSRYEINEYGQLREKIKQVKGIYNIFSGGGYIGGRLSVHGYHTVSITDDNGKRWTHSQVSQLVAFAYLSKPDVTRTQVNHIDGNKLNNHYSNLEWTTPKENTHHSLKTGLKETKVTPEQVTEIRLMYINTDKSPLDISKIYGISKGHVIGIIRTWYWNIVELPMPKAEYFKKVSEKETSLRSKSQSSKPNHPTRKLTKDEIIEMRRLWDSGEVTKKNQLAKQFNMHPSTIKDILDRKIHKYI